MGDGAQATEDFLQLGIRKEQGIAPGKQDVANLRVLLEVAEGGLPLGFEVLLADAGDDARTGAVAAVGGAAVGDEKEHAVGVAVDQAGDRHVGILAARVGHFLRSVPALLDPRDHLAADRAIGVVAIDQVEIVRRDRHRQLAACQQHAGALLVGELQPFFQRRQRGDAVLQLPGGVVPFGHRFRRPVAGGVGAEGGVEVVWLAHRGSAKIGGIRHLSNDGLRR